jgi:prolyl-tRNA synthetase
MKATFLDPQGKAQLFIMGCYGIGVSRIIAALIEQSHDTNGIIWPINLAPYTVVIVPIDYKDPRTKETSDKIYNGLADKKIEVLIDDRDERPGVKFKDADLVGIPIRITVSSKTIDKNQVELKYRNKPDTAFVDISAIIETVTNRLQHT